MNYYDEELQRLQQEMMEKERADAKLADLYIQQNELEKKAADLKKIMEDEQEDVDRLNRKSLTAFYTGHPERWEKSFRRKKRRPLRLL